MKSKKMEPKKLQSNKTILTTLFSIATGLFVWSSGYAHAELVLDDQLLSNESDHLERITAGVVTAAQQDLAKPVSRQNQINQTIAEAHKRRLTQDNLNAGVLSEYEEQKKVNEPIRMRSYTEDKRPLAPSSQVISVERIANMTGGEISNARGEVTITVTY